METKLFFSRKPLPFLLLFLFFAGCGLFAAGRSGKEDAMLTEKAAEQMQALGIGPDYAPDAGLFRTDPEFMSNLYNFAYGEVLSRTDIQIPERDRHLAVLAAVLGTQGTGEFETVLRAALNGGISPVEAKEVIYQSVAYLGFAKVRPFLSAANGVMEDMGFRLPLEPQGTVTQENRREEGNRVQVEIFGGGMRESWLSGPEERAAVNSFLASNCFGDYYTRGGLSLKDRELVTFCFLIAQGGCEPQAVSHAAGNFAMGNDREYLFRVVSNLTPYIGYPRTLNAMGCIETAAKN